MSDAKARKKLQQKFLIEHPRCYFCGGINPAVTIDHVPPQACFPDGYAPQSFESPACKGCNQGSKKQDQIFGLYSLLVDFDESKMRQEEHIKKILKLKQGIVNNYPEALPETRKAHPVTRIGSVITPDPVAFALPVSSAVQDAIMMMGKKLTHALYYREVGKILSQEHRFYASSYQPQRGGTEKLNSFLTSTLPKETIGQRTNIKKYGDRFKYISGHKTEDDFFVFAAQFGHGVIVWGIVCGPGIEKPSDGPLSSAHWLSGACGPGATSL
jgi:hypothetical protein